MRSTWGLGEEQSNHRKETRGGEPNQECGNQRRAPGERHCHPGQDCQARPLEDRVYQASSEVPDDFEQQFSDEFGHCTQNGVFSASSLCAAAIASRRGPAAIRLLPWNRLELSYAFQFLLCPLDKGEREEVHTNCASGLFQDCFVGRKIDGSGLGRRGR